jgi:hypothetical protein
MKLTRNVLPAQEHPNTKQAFQSIQCYGKFINYTFYRLLVHWNFRFEYHSRHGCIFVLICVVQTCEGTCVFNSNVSERVIFLTHKYYEY